MSLTEADLLQVVPGIGPATAEKLGHLDLKTVGDLLNWYPRQYIDASHPVLIAEAQKGELVAIEATVKKVHKRRSKSGMQMVEAVMEDLSGEVTVNWFNQPFLVDKLKQDSRWILIGEIGWFGGKRSMLSPLIEDQPEILAVYGQSRGITSKMLRGFVRSALRYTQIADYPLPATWQNERNLLGREQALKALHQPTSMEMVEAGRSTLAYFEVFSFFLQLLSQKEDLRSQQGIRIESKLEELKNWVAALPFTLTDGQRKAIWEILKEMESGKVMTRLLNGDVGSGKTVIAGLVMACIAKCGYKSVLLVPTEVLAQQHTRTLLALLKSAEVRVATWTASTKDEEIENADIIVGTHAVLQQGFKVAKLGLVVIDEQHRFGVRQRQLLRQNQSEIPHFLSMTATPIPRSLALTLFGSLSLSVLQELPKERLPIKTEIMKSALERERMHRLILEEIKAGNQVFVICPLIREKKAATSDEELSLFSEAELEKAGSKTVEQEVKRLREEHPEYGVIEALHGKMKAAEKEKIMEHMRLGEINVLVATSVIEVGVDIANATVMVIEGAERFGLAQLHQFRGRVGRSNKPSFCFLCPDLSNSKIIQRLQVLVEKSDGFSIAEADLAMRGPGELIGNAQSGLPDFRMATLTDLSFLQNVRSDAETFMSEFPQETALILQSTVLQSGNSVE